MSNIWTPAGNGPGQYNNPGFQGTTEAQGDQPAGGGPTGALLEFTLPLQAADDVVLFTIPMGDTPSPNPVTLSLSGSNSLVTGGVVITSAGGTSFTVADVTMGVVPASYSLPYVILGSAGGFTTWEAQSGSFPLSLTLTFQTTFNWTPGMIAQVDVTYAGGVTYGVSGVQPLFFNYQGNVGYADVVWNNGGPGGGGGSGGNPPGAPTNYQELEFCPGTVYNEQQFCPGTVFTGNNNQWGES